MSKHTPGPWVYQKELGTVDALFGKMGMGPSELSPVMMLGKGRNVDANGFLIAAAPDLLEAAKKLMLVGCCWYGGYGCEDEYCGYCQLKKAIAKAEGGI